MSKALVWTKHPADPEDGVTVPYTCLVFADLVMPMQVYLSEASLDASLTTAKSSAINVLIPGRDDEDMTELYVPEQFISTITNGVLITEAVSHSG